MKKEVYKPRKGKANANKYLYKESQIKKIKQLAGNVLKRMGYVNEESSINSNTGFYSDDEDIQSSCESQLKSEQDQDVKT